MTFNGTHKKGMQADIQTKAFNFEDKCESDNFIMTQGQAMHIRGNLTGHLEVLVDEINGVVGGTPLFYFYDTNGDLYDSVDFATISGNSIWDGTVP